MFEGYDTHILPGWLDGTVGYHADDGKIFEAGCEELGREVEGVGYYDDVCETTSTRIL